MSPPVCDGTCGPQEDLPGRRFWARILACLAFSGCLFFVAAAVAAAIYAVIWAHRHP